MTCKKGERDREEVKEEGRGRGWGREKEEGS